LDLIGINSILIGEMKQLFGAVSMELKNNQNIGPAMRREVATFIGRTYAQRSENWGSEYHFGSGFISQVAFVSHQRGEKWL
jgi:hypothetical protein